MKKLGYLLLLLYVFIIPLYERHFEAWIGERSRQRDQHELTSGEKAMCWGMCCLWPVAMMTECASEYIDSLEGKP